MNKMRITRCHSYTMIRNGLQEAFAHLQPVMFLFQVKKVNGAQT